MKIHESDNVPDSTYFRTASAEPEINEDGSITILNGQGTRRSSWGAPGVTSTVVYEDCDLIAVHVGFYHKHGGGQFWRYYTTDGTETRQVTWAKLPDEARQVVLEAYEDNAPSWAKSPGKLRSQYRKPSVKVVTTFKLVGVNGKSMFSLYKPHVNYELGKRLADAVDPQAGTNEWGEVYHGGGYYSHPTTEQVLNLLATDNLVPDRCLENVGKLALIKCEASGRIARFPNGKIASTYLKPVEVLDIIEVA